MGRLVTLYSTDLNGYLATYRLAWLNASVLAQIVIYHNLEAFKRLVDERLRHLELSRNSPDLLVIEAGSKLGVEQVKKIRDFFSLKPYSAKARMVIVESAQSLTEIAQNSLLKTVEELPDYGGLVIGVDNLTKLLPTLISRMEIIQLDHATEVEVSGQAKFERLVSMSLRERFEYVEKLKDHQAELESLARYFEQNLADHLGFQQFARCLLQAREWQNSNVNNRAIFEYLMLSLPN